MKAPGVEIGLVWQVLRGLSLDRLSVSREGLKLIDKISCQIDQSTTITVYQLFDWVFL